MPLVQPDIKPQPSHADFHLHIGSNAIPALQGLGVLEAILAKVNAAHPSQRLFRFLSGIGDEQIYDVSFRNPTSELSSIFNSMVSTALEIWGLGSIGTPISQNFLKLLTTSINDSRPMFLDALVPLLDPGVTKFNKRCVSLGRTSTGRQVIHFADHTTFEADLVIGADGIKSVVRNAVVSDNHIVFSNTYAYRGLIPIDTLKSAGLKSDVQSSPHNWVGLNGVCTSLLVLGILNQCLYYIWSNNST